MVRGHKGSGFRVEGLGVSRGPTDPTEQFRDCVNMFAGASGLRKQNLLQPTSHLEVQGTHSPIVPVLQSLV